VWGYPVVPALTIVLLVGVLVATFVQNIVPSLVGTGIILVSLPIYYLIRFLEKRAKAPR
jgi:basic amino acid/polyamine antiporter, APA family